MERYKIVFEALEGYTLTDIKYFGDYTNPPIPEDWLYVEGKWNSGYVIQDFDGNQFVWVPVGFLDSNGTLDGIHFSEKFGRRNYLDDEFSDVKFNEKLDDELLKQWESVKKYGGFYISRYNISQNKETGDAQSVKGEIPWTNINWHDAMEVAKDFGSGASVNSHLPFGAEYDSILEWFIKSGARTEEEVVRKSNEWGNFWNNKNPIIEVVKTGTHEKWSTMHICDFAGNVAEWTQEMNESSYRVIRGGYDEYGNDYPVAYRDFCYPNRDFFDIGFRAALYIK